MVSHPSIALAQCCLTSVFEWELVSPTWQSFWPDIKNFSPIFRAQKPVNVPEGVHGLRHVLLGGADAGDDGGQTFPLQRVCKEQLEVRLVEIYQGMESKDVIFIFTSYVAS